MRSKSVISNTPHHGISFKMLTIDNQILSSQKVDNVKQTD
jgi:hypothetical protein